MHKLRGQRSRRGGDSIADFRQEKSEGYISSTCASRTRQVAIVRDRWRAMAKAARSASPKPKSTSPHGGESPHGADALIGAIVLGPEKVGKQSSGSKCKCAFTPASARPFSEAPAAQRDRVYDFGSQGCRFEPWRLSRRKLISCLFLDQYPFRLYLEPRGNHKT